MLNRFSLAWVGFLWGSLSLGYLPPVSVMLDGVVEKRRPYSALQLTLQHRVALQQDQAISLEETLVASGSRLWAHWKVLGVASGFYARFSGKQYQLANGLVFPTQSNVVRAYLLASEADSVGLQNALVSERFIRTEQLKVYQEGFELLGDPKEWNLKENRIVHPEVFLERKRKKITNTVVGWSVKDQRRSVHFARSLRGIQRIEWVGNGQTLAWNFDQFKRMRGGWHPTTLSFEVGGSDMVTSTLKKVQGLGKKPFQTWLANWKAQAKLAKKSKTPALTGNVESALRLLLSYR